MNIFRCGGISFDLQNTVLKGPHNCFNATCAILVAQRLGVANAVIQEALESFVNDPHRLEQVATVNGIRYINDSKATNVDAVFYALQAVDEPIVWIVGGIDKGNNYESLIPLVTKKVKAVICMGLDNQKLIETFSPHTKIIEETKSAKEAVERASIYAENGDVVMLSPACSSFDLFKNYKDRGDQFKAAVRQLTI